MAYGVIKIIPASQHLDVSLSGQGGGTQYPSVKVLNPNDGVVYCARNRDCMSIGYGDWDWKVPSQSYAMLPGPFASIGVYYLDQSGAGRQGEITIYPSQAKLDEPMFVAVGRSLLAFQTTLDVTEGTQPANPGAGLARLWVDATDVLHLLNSGGIDELEISTRTALGGVLTGTLPNPGIASPLAGGVSNWSGLATFASGLTVNNVAANFNAGIGVTGQSQFFSDLITANVGVQTAVVAGKALAVHGASQLDSQVVITGGGIDVTGASTFRALTTIEAGGLALHNIFTPTPTAATVVLSGLFGSPVGGGVAPAPTLKGTGFGAGFGFVGWWQINVNGGTVFVPYYS